VNWTPGMGVATLAIALLQRDGMFAIISFGFFVFSCVAAPMMIGAGLAGLDYVIGTISQWVHAITG
jgi:hypothetical protein